MPHTFVFIDLHSWGRGGKIVKKMSIVIDPYKNAIEKIKSQLMSPSEKPTHDMIVTAVAEELQKWVGVNMAQEGYGWATWICDDGLGMNTKKVMERTLEKIENEFGVFPENGKSNELLMQKFHQLFLENKKPEV